MSNWEADSRSAAQFISRLLRNTTNPLQCSQQRANGPGPKTQEPTPQFHMLLTRLNDPSLL